MLNTFSQLGRRTSCSPFFVSNRSYFFYRHMKRNEGKPDFKYVPAEKDLKIMDPKELEEEMAKINATSGFDQLESPVKFVDESEKVESFKRALQDPMKAHVADIAVRDYRITRAKEFGSFKHRVSTSMATVFQDYQEDNELLEDYPISHSQNGYVLDNFEFEEEKDDITEVKYKIQANLYDEIEIIEDENASFSPDLNDNYNKSNFFHQLGKEDPITMEKLKRADKKLAEINAYLPGIDSNTTKLKNEMWAGYLLDDNHIERMLPEIPSDIKNIKPSAISRSPNRKPMDNYSHYEELLHDMFAKLLPEEGFLRVDPGWKWMNLEVGNKVDGLSPFYVLPTCQYSFPNGILVLKIAKFLKVNDKYLCPVECKKEIEILSTQKYMIEKYFSDAKETADVDNKIQYLKDGTDERYLIINLRFGTFGVANYGETGPDSDPLESNPLKVHDKNRKLTNREIFEKSKTGDDTQLEVFRLPPEWVLAIKKTRFPVVTGTGLNSPARRLHARMLEIERTNNDDAPLRADMSELAQNLGFRMEANDPFISKVFENKYYEMFPNHQRENGFLFDQ